MFELSCADYTFPLLGRLEALTLIRLLQFDFVDIGLFARNPNFLPSALQASPQRFIEDVKNDLEATWLSPADVFLQIGEDPAQASVNDPDSAVRQAGRELFSRTMELCFAIGCAHVTGLPGVLHDDWSYDFALAVEEAAWRVETAAKAGVIYAIEPHLGSICNDTSVTRDLLSQVPGLTLTLDYGHFIFQGETNDAIHTLLPYASHLHLRGAAPGQLQTPVHKSSVDLRDILRTLNRDYKGKLALEYVWSEWHGCNRTDNLSETILLRRQINEIKANLTPGVSHDA